MRQVTKGDTVRVHYRGTLDDGTAFDDSAEHGPLEVTIGGGTLINGFEAALMGMAAGETKTVKLEPDEAYGQHDAGLVHTLERAQIPPQIDLEVGTELQAQDSNGNPVRLVVTAFDGESVTLDANHPLAGKALTFELELVEFAS